MLGLVSAAVFGELPAAIGWLGVAGLAVGGALYVRRRGRLRERQPEPVAEGLRLSRGLPRARDRGRGAAVRGDRICGAAARLGCCRGAGLAAARTHSRQSTVVAGRVARMTGPASMAQQVHVQLELLTGGVSASIWSCSTPRTARRAEQAAGACPRARRACPQARRASRRRTAARTRRSSSDPGQGGQVVAGLLEADVG